MEINKFLKQYLDVTHKTIIYSQDKNLYLCYCPAHNDVEMTLEIDKGPEATSSSIRCMAGCDYDKILSALKLSHQDISEKPIILKDASSVKITEYHYPDETGKIIFTKVREEPGSNGKKKDFKLQRIDEYGNLVKNIAGCRRVLYKLPDLIKGIQLGKIVFLVEGEKDVETLTKYKLIATTACISTEWQDEYTNIFKDARVVILFDCDMAGFKRRDMLIEKLYGKVKSLRVVDLPGLKYQDNNCKDITDWLNADNTIEQLKELVKNTPEYCKKYGELRVTTPYEILTTEIKPREMLLDPVIPEKGLVLIYSYRGVGKTHVAFGMAHAVSTGGSFLKWKAPKPRKVLYIDGEMTLDDIKKRLKSIDTFENIQKQNPDFLQIITPDNQDRGMPNLATDEGQKIIEEYVEDRDVIFIDNMSCMFRGIAENDAEGWSPVQEWALDLKRRGKSIVFIHHAGKNGTQRGSSKKEDAMDIVIKLEHPSDYKMNEGARFEVIFEKTRQFMSADAESFEAHMVCVNGLATWKITSSSKTELLEQVVLMRKDKIIIEEIVKKLNITKYQVETLIKKAKELGLLD